MPSIATQEGCWFLNMDYRIFSRRAWFEQFPRRYPDRQGDGMHGLEAWVRDPVQNIVHRARDVAKTHAPRALAERVN